MISKRHPTPAPNEQLVCGFLLLDALLNLRNPDHRFCWEMPDANTLAIGSTLTPGFWEGRGRVSIYSWNGESWVSSGGLYGTHPGDHIGDVFHMPDAGAVLHAGTAHEFA